ncbi:MAG: carbohydrate-binding protein [Phycisphaerae bacterium]|nr:carbohydrate-binding protein [Gemmatimonadaceae bacterium]
MARLQNTRGVLADTHAQILRANAESVDIGAAGIWLLDNYHVVQEHIQEVRATLPRGYYRELPELTSGPLAGYPRVYDVAIALISHTEARVDLENTELFIEAFQSVQKLSVGELWAVPAMLRLGLIESVRRMALRVAQRLEEVEEADKWARRMHGAGQAGGEALSDELGRFHETKPQPSPTFVSRFLRQAREAAGAFPPLEWLEQWTRDEGVNPEEAVVASTQQLAITQLIMANSITSLRALGGRDWRELVERQSAMERVLRRDPAGVHARMTFDTRDRYRHVIERIAKRTGFDEVIVAEWAIRLAENAVNTDEPAPRRHIGYYLEGAGLAQLEQRVGYSTSVFESVYRFVRRHPTRVFVASVAVATVGALLAVLALAGDAAGMAWPLVVAFAFIPANDIAVSLVNQLVTAFLPTQMLPRIDFEHTGIAKDCRTVVVVPTLFDSVEDVRDTLAHLEVQYLANRDNQLQFAVLSDFTDAVTQEHADDGAIIEQALQGIRELNERHSPSVDVFHLLHRKRAWNAAENVWMGWERKRGKLSQFNKLAQGEGASAFAYASDGVHRLEGARYVITLDADTVLPPGAARELVGTMAHPLNRPLYDPSLGRVTSGYGVLQPRVGVSLPSANRSRFASIMAGVPGVDPYTTAVSDLYQDLFHEGSFTGKGIYDVEAFELATTGRFPENTLLSHDLIEGNYARAGLVTDIVVYDDYPTRYLTWTRRKHRWIRGDWQLLPWLSRWVPGPQGSERNRLSLLSQWKILDNMRRSIVDIAALAFLLAGWTILPGSALRWTLLVFGAIAAPWIIAVIITALRPPSDKSWRSYYRAAAEDAFSSAKQVALAITFLPHQVWTAADAIVRALYRLAVSRQHLLEWQTAQRTEQLQANDQQAIRRAMQPSLLFVLTLSLAVTAHEYWKRTHAVPGAPWMGELVSMLAVWSVAALWLWSPRIARQLSAPIRASRSVLSSGARADALRYAELHWKFFERFATEETHWLAPDNFQEDPAPVVAMRTSPTNIGLQLLSIVSAHDMGFIGLAEMEQRLQQVFATLDKLSKYRGHYYNWYDLNDLRVLEPAYISTVDSGNLAGHLVAFRQACIELGMTELADRANIIVQEMDFSFLFDEQRKLFSIGYHAASHTQDVSRYDLLASEARVASFMAIANNQAPVEHWFLLGRGLTHSEGATALVSWTGTMFEYLMPVLIMRTFRATVLSATYRAALQRQISYAERRDIPWGISESAFNVRDREFTYQYRAFGIPDLALKRGMGRDLVVAPYASALAAMIDPARSLQNLRVLETCGMLGAYGFYDAMDFTRPTPGERFAVVQNYMSHHVGMTLVSLTNVLHDFVWQRRFHADARVRSVELLLHERIPRRIALQEPQEAHVPTVRAEEGQEQPVAREFTSHNTVAPQVALLGYQPYTVMLTQSGSGYSRFNGLAVTRWKADATLENTGTFCYVQDVSAGRHWSVAHQPTCITADRYSAVLATDRVTFTRLDGDIETRTEIVANPADAAEVRRVTLTNTSNEDRVIQLTSYGEIVLASPEADSAHPAFSNLFVETEWHAWCNALTATRRPRSPSDTPVWCVHVLARGADQHGEVSYETDRAHFLGRGRTVRNPAVLEDGGVLSGTTGAVLDPIFSLRTSVTVPAGRSVSVAFTTFVAATRERAFELADRYRDAHAAQRALDLAWTSTQIELNELGISPADAAIFQELAGHLFFAGDALGPARELRERNRASQGTLWSLGISGDLPILQVTIDSVNGLPMLRQLFAAHRYWRRRGLLVDFVVINAQEHGYLEELTGRVHEAMLSAADADYVDRSGGVFLRRADAMHEEATLMLAASARVVIASDERTLADVVASARETELAPIVPIRNTFGSITPRYTQVERRGEHSLAPGRVSPASMLRVEPLRFDNGYGGLDEHDNYHIRLVDGKLPPAPWSNVVANVDGGFQISERGGGCVWAESSYFYRLTAWQNDPVSDPVTDALYLRDEESGALWSATPAPVKTAASFIVVHGPGFTTFETEQHGVASHLTMGVPVRGAVKISILRLTNNSRRARKLSLTAYAEWTLGAQRAQTRHAVRTWFAEGADALMAQNRFEAGFADRVAFMTLSEPVRSFTASRAEFIGRNGALAYPLAFRRTRLGGETGVGLDPCAALQCELTLDPGETREVAVLLGSGLTESDTLSLVDSLRTVEKASAALSAARQAWDDRLSTITVRTPEPALNAMLNKWSLYQALSGRMWARMGLYQSSGAYGFRDQLQDVMAFVYAEPKVARDHILRAARRQFLEGDVQHWWHPHTGRGVRTRFSDDLVWLPYVVDHYVRVTGDVSVLDEYVPFLKMRVLEEQEHEVYDLPEVTDEHGSIYEHCLRALHKACTVGEHGLPFIGTGDWNDGFSRVGAEGKGESVWLAWFLILTLRNFANRADAHGDSEVAQQLRTRANNYASAVELHGWDGNWYRRAYFDDGAPLGSASSDECRIDAIAQSWSVISKAGSPKRQEQAMRAMDRQLVREDARLIMLLTPPFDKGAHDPGYIKGYLPGVRENGAQYTHGALWAVMATAMRGDRDRAFALYQMINPLTHGDSARAIETYKVEPYVVAADVYTAKGHVGRGGWTWYTGSASWMYRVGLENILGFTQEGDTLRILPCVPTNWPEYSISYRFGTSVYQITVHEPGAIARQGGLVMIDGVSTGSDIIQLTDDGRAHVVNVRPAAVRTDESMSANGLRP